MFNNKKLIITLILVSTIALLVQWLSYRKASTFSTSLFTIDTTQITTISIQPPNQEVALQLFKEKDQWYVQKADFIAPADPIKVQTILLQLTQLKPDWLAAKTKEKWSNYAVDPAAATKVTMMHQQKILLDIMVGKTAFDHEQPTTQAPIEEGPQGAVDYDALMEKAEIEKRKRNQSIHSFIRLHDQEETYATHGYLQYFFDKPLHHWRNGNIVQLQINKLNTIIFDYPNQPSFTLTKSNTQWQVDNQTADEVKMKHYLENISQLSDHHFDDEFSTKAMPPLCQVTFQGDSISPVVVKCYPGTETAPYTFHTSQNPNTYFSPQSTKVYQALFISKKDLLP